MKVISLVLLVFLYSCSETTDKDIETSKETKTEVKSKTDHLLKGHQDAIQKAKDMEKEVLKAAEEQKKAIDDLDG